VNVFQAEREVIAGKLTAAGCPGVTLDPRAPLPCVLVDVPSVENRVGVGGWSCSIPVRILAAPPGGVDAAAWMLDQLEIVLGAYPAALPAVPGTHPRGDSDVPAYTVPVALTVTNPTC